MFEINDVVLYCICWQINFVFDRLEVTRPFNGPVLLLEEDHYVTEDFIYVLLKMYRMKQK